MKQRGANSQKPSSAPSKNRIRSQSPIDGQNNATQGVQSTAANSGAAVQKKMIGNNYNGGSSNTQKMMSNTGGFSGIMQGQRMNMMGSGGNQ